MSKVRRNFTKIVCIQYSITFFCLLIIPAAEHHLILLRQYNHSNIPFLKSVLITVLLAYNETLSEYERSAPAGLCTTCTWIMDVTLIHALRIRIILASFDIAVDQQTKAHDRNFEGVSDFGCPLVAAGQPRPYWVNVWHNFAKSP